MESQDSGKSGGQDRGKSGGDYRSKHSLTSPPKIPNVASLNVKITPELFVGTNYKDWAYSAMMELEDLGELDILIARFRNQVKMIQKFFEWIFVRTQPNLV